MKKGSIFEGGALEGIRVLDLTRVLAGPFCTMIMADMGAEVIKIEVPGRGDDAREYPPFIQGMSAYFMNLNRNKKSVALDLKKRQGKDIFLKLVEKSDVVVENFRPGTMERLGIGYKVLKDLNPGLVYASISGFGQYGRYKDRPGYDIIGQAMGGLMSVTGWPGGPPTRTGCAIADILAGLSCCIGILASLKARDKLGRGQRVDVALVDSVVVAMEAVIQIFTVEGRVPKRIGNRYEFIYPYDTFKTKDSWVVIAIGNDKNWQRFCQAIGRKDLASNLRFSTNKKRVEEYEKVKKIVEEWTLNRRSEEIVSYLLRKGVPCCEVYSVDRVVSDEHIAKDREMIVEMEHPTVGKVKLTGCHIKMSVTKPSIKKVAPCLNQDAKEILSNLLGFSTERIKQLQEKKFFKNEENLSTGGRKGIKSALKTKRKIIREGSS